MRTFYNGTYSGIPARELAIKWVKQNASGLVSVRVAISPYATSTPITLDPTYL